MVAHPSLTQEGKPLHVILGYYYGDGYAAGISLKYFNGIQKVFWFLRIVFGALFYLVKQRNKMHKPPDKCSMLAFRKTACFARLIGFSDGLKDKLPRSNTYLSKLASN